MFTKKFILHYCLMKNRRRLTLTPLPPHHPTPIPPKNIFGRMINDHNDGKMFIGTFCINSGSFHKSWCKNQITLWFRQSRKKLTNIPICLGVLDKYQKRDKSLANGFHRLQWKSSIIWLFSSTWQHKHLGGWSNEIILVVHIKQTKYLVKWWISLTKQKSLLQIILFLFHLWKTLCG